LVSELGQENKARAVYLNEYMLGGMERFLLDKALTVACGLKEPHLVELNIVYISDRRKSVFGFCPIHKDFFEAGYNKSITILE